MKEQLRLHLRSAFIDDEEMSLMSSVEGITQAEAEWKMNETTWTIEEILYHVASCKAYYCKQGFNNIDFQEIRPFGNIKEMINYNANANELLLSCMESCTEETLLKPIPTRCHGESAAHFFFVMLMHDVNHAAEIRAIRRAYGSLSDYYEIEH